MKSTTINRLKIRVAKITDAGAIISLLEELKVASDNMIYSGDELAVNVEQEQKIIKWFATNPNSEMLVAEVDCQIIALITIEGESYRRVKHNAELALVIKSEFWGQGIGNVLLNEAIAYAKALGKTNLQIRVKADNDPAINLYHKCGFYQVGILNNYFINGEQQMDLLIMQKITN